jgi:hypothetical protein
MSYHYYTTSTTSTTYSGYYNTSQRKKAAKKHRPLSEESELLSIMISDKLKRNKEVFISLKMDTRILRDLNRVSGGTINQTTVLKVLGVYVSSFGNHSVITQHPDILAGRDIKISFCDLEPKFVNEFDTEDMLIILPDFE